MALTVDDYKHPIGELKVTALWPRLEGETAAERDDRADEIIEAYRVQAYSQTSSDAATKQWVYYRAWSEKADDLNAIPASASNDEGSRDYTASQIEYWSLKAAAALAAYEGLVDEEAGDTTAYGVITSYR